MSTDELEWRLIYALIVAGKSAGFANAAVARLRREIPEEDRDSPIAWLSIYPFYFTRAKTGNYAKLEQAIIHLAHLRYDLATVSPEELEKVFGIGPKTARFFVAWTRPSARVAVLDRHVLRWLAQQGVEGVPKQTPRSSSEYLRLEAEFLRLADRAGLLPRDLDLAVWGKAARVPNLVEGYDVG